MRKVLEKLEKLVIVKEIGEDFPNRAEEIVKLFDKEFTTLIDVAVT